MTSAHDDRTEGEGESREDASGERASGDAWLDAVKFDEKGLVVVLALDVLTGEPRMVAWANREALARTASTGEAHFYSRSRGALWRKGESSGHVLAVRSMYLDCDGDAVLVMVEPAGPSCHTGAPSCFFRVRDGGAWRERARPLAMMERLEAALEARASGEGERSYTRSLLLAGAAKIGAKLREEAGELAAAIESESDERVASEAADVIYHLCVGLLSRKVSWRAVLVELARRFGTSGIDEKQRRSTPAR
ncbi:MAG: bifunctional phosphoribosyl-AMP cyclohydrolase/phosphoribosyl-ATP diphosphatase HisIE [Myxococcales bacterium]|nr:bifunctional phosphoribosyl-AMP cyclohydrolase/phosphoribosyl-ATP diphosphatase HisIE [Myxococcales bacterium]